MDTSLWVAGVVLRFLSTGVEVLAIKYNRWSIVFPVLSSFKRDSASSIAPSLRRCRGREFENTLCCSCSLEKSSMWWWWCGLSCSQGNNAKWKISTLKSLSVRAACLTGSSSYSNVKRHQRRDFPAQPSPLLQQPSQFVDRVNVVDCRPTPGYSTLCIASVT